MTFNQLLTEEEELDTFDKVITAIERGRVPGVKPSSLDDLEDGSVFNYQLRTIITAFKHIPSIYRNAAIKLAIKNFIDKGDLSTNVDAYYSYFNNRNKKEAKTTYKKLFTDFEEGNIKGREFEQKVNDIFRDKSVGKEDADKLYEDDTWLMVIPKTYAASCKYGENTKWCTTGSKERFESYSMMSPLLIIINKKTNKKYQAHRQSGSFMDETNNMPENLIEILKSFPEKVQEILSKYIGFGVWNNALIKAIEKGNIEQAKEALNNDANVNYSDGLPLYNAVNNDDIEMAELLLRKGAKGNVLPISVRKNNLEMAKMLIRKGADIHKDNELCLRIAVIKNNLEMVKMLLDKGADVHANNNAVFKVANKNTKVFDLLNKYKEKK